MQVPGKALKQRYLALDALRGIVSVSVVIYHAAGPTWLRPRFGYLGVDVFFVLSGFVLAKRYDADFAAGLRPIGFLWARIKRLYPLYAVGLALGVLVVLLRLSPHVSPAQGIAAFLPNAALFPHPFATGDGFAFPDDIPTWSLFLELWAANLFWAVFWRRLRERTLIAIIAGCGCALLLAKHTRSTLDGGPRSSDLEWGIPRVGFSFSAGVLLARLHDRQPPSLRLPSWLIIGSIVAIMVAPLQGRMSHWFETAAVLIAFPALAFYGADAVERRPWLGSALGDASYAVYVIHVPLLVAAVGFLGHGLRGFQVIVFCALAAVMGYWLQHFDRLMRLKRPPGVLRG